jgi:hypothetical protein
VGDAKLGRYVFPRPVINIRPLPAGFPAEPIIGTIVLQQFVVTLDQANARIRFEHEGPTTIELPARGVRGSAPPLSAPAGAAPPGASAPTGAPQAAAPRRTRRGRLPTAD